MCADHDLILLQEHWLLPDELQILSDVHIDFLACGSSAVDIGSNILVGRPYGGTAILYRRRLAECITVEQTDDSRYTAYTRYGPVLILSVYMWKGDWGRGFGTVLPLKLEWFRLLPY